MIGLVWVTAALAQAPPSEALQALATGHFVLAEAPTTYQPRLEAAVEQGMEALPFFIKPLARLRLQPAVEETVCPALDLALDGDTLQVSCGGEQAPFVRRLDGSDGPILDDTGAYQVEIRYGADWVGMRFAGEKGGQGYRYEFRPDGGMVLHGTIFSPYLPADLSWSLAYRREGG